MYNAKSDAWSKSLDLAHKILNPSTYNCSLCNLTHGNFSEKEVWKNFREYSETDFVFMYKDVFVKKYPDYNDKDFPIILEMDNGKKPVILFDAQKLTSITSVEELIEILQKKI